MVIELLRREHRDIEKLLLVLERELGIFARGGHPDYEVIHAVICYFQIYPDTCHHPLEDAVFEKLTQLRVGALVIGPDNLFTTRSGQLALLTVRHTLPAIYEFREFAAAGGLMSYGASVTEYFRLVGTYASRILKGDKPADLPVQQSTKVELFLNLKTAKALGITVPLPLSGRADEIFE